MLDINPLRASITDLALVESHFEVFGREWPQQPAPTIAFCNRAIDAPQIDGYIVVGVESDISVGIEGLPTDDPSIVCNLTVGCTVAAPCPSDDSSIRQQLIKQAIEVNTGFARTLIYQQSLASQLPKPLIIPPLEFDGKLDA